MGSDAGSGEGVTQHTRYGLHAHVCCLCEQRLCAFSYTWWKILSSFKGVIG
jgi:hypothetical protein